MIKDLINVYEFKHYLPRFIRRQRLNSDLQAVDRFAEVRCQIRFTEGFTQSWMCVTDSGDVFA